MQNMLGGTEDAFVTVVEGGSALVYSTYLGGSAADYGLSIAVDPGENVYVVGWTASTDFPTDGAFQPLYAGGSTDAFVTKIVTPNLPPGTPCIVAGQCASNNCVDGVCCDTSCTDQCEACDVTGEVGTCSAVLGMPHGTRPTCGTGACMGTCDGEHPTCTYPATQCGSSCSNGVEIDSVCDGDGGCNAQPPFSCANFVCANDFHCKTLCRSNADCAAGFECHDGECQPSPVCVNDHRSRLSDGGTADCVPFACGDSGLCNSTCATATDCATGWACTDGSCVLAPYATSGCSIGAPNGSPPWLAAFILFLARACRSLRRRSVVRGPLCIG